MPVGFWSPAPHKHPILTRRPSREETTSGSVARVPVGACAQPRAGPRRNPMVLRRSGLRALRNTVGSASLRGVRPEEERNCQLVRQDSSLGKVRRAEGSSFFSISCIFCTAFNVLIDYLNHAHFPGQIGLYTEEAITWACSHLSQQSGQEPLWGHTRLHYLKRL